MSLLFGDNPVSYSSRAVDDDDDDDEEFGHKTIDESTESVVQWSPVVRSLAEGSSLTCTTLLISIGRVATGFVQVNLLESQPSELIGSVCSGLADDDINTFGQKSLSDKTCYVHRLKDFPDAIIVQCNTVVRPEQSYSWTERLCSALRLEAAQVTVLSSGSLTLYKSERLSSDLPSNFLRALRSRSCMAKPACPYLEQPNTISGLPAQLLTYCELRKISCILYVCFTDSLHVEVDTIRCFNKLLRCPPLNSIAKENPRANDQLSAIVRLYSNQSLPYI